MKIKAEGQMIESGKCCHHVHVTQELVLFSPQLEDESAEMKPIETYSINCVMQDSYSGIQCLAVVGT